MRDLLAKWKQEERAPFSGLDFSRLNSRVTEDPLPWSYEKWLREFLKADTQLLDMGTGGGEFLLSLNHPYANTSVTVGWEPDFLLCRKKLEPMGIRVEFTEEGKPLPFPDESFDLVINRHQRYCLAEIHRVLKKGGHFITQQVGAKNGLALSRRLGLGYSSENPQFNLENEVTAFQKAGFRVVKRDQAYPLYHVKDMGALCDYCKAIPWEYPDFSVDRCKRELLELEAELQKNEEITFQQHRFVLVAKKK